MWLYIKRDNQVINLDGIADVTAIPIPPTRSKPQETGRVSLVGLGNESLYEIDVPDFSLAQTLVLDIVRALEEQQPVFRITL